MNLTPNYYKNRVALNTDEAAIEDMKKYQAVTQNGLSVGLGAGDPNQSAMVSRVSKVLQPQHVNQVFTGVGTSRALLGQNDTVINGLVSPTGKVGIVNVATGPKSSQKAAAEVPVATAIARHGRHQLQVLPNGRPEARRRVPCSCQGLRS